MKIDADTITTLRSICLGLTGLVCLIYAVLALATGDPRPMPWWIPGGFGIASAALIWTSAILGGRRAIETATDELYQMVNHKAQRHAYWINIVVFIAVAPLPAQDVIDYRTAMSVIGTMMGASYLLLLVFYEWRTG